MILSVCVAILLPFVAYSWNPYLAGTELGFTPPKLSQPAPLKFGQPAPLKFGQPAPPSCYSSQQTVQKPANLLRNGKGKRNEQTVSQDPSTTPPPSPAPAAATDVVEEEAPWMNPTHHQRRFVGLKSDHILREEVNVPSGTRMTWFKNNESLEPNGNSNGATSTLSSSRLVVATMVYIDCAKISDGGLYRLQLDIPDSSYNWHRNYTVIIVDWSGIPGASCRFTPNEMAYIPRIYKYAHRAYVSVGGSVILPCGFQGLLSDVAWYFNNTLISSDHQHETTPGGDLVIRQTNASEPLHYTCYVWSTAYANLQDQENTAVYVLE